MHQQILLQCENIHYLIFNIKIFLVVGGNEFIPKPPQKRKHILRISVTHESSLRQESDETECRKLKCVSYSSR